MKISDEHISQIEEGLKAFPENMSAAARYINMPFQSFVRRTKFLGLYAPNQGQAEARIEKQRSVLWQHASMAEKRRRVLAEQNDNCLICGIGEWNNQPLTIELDHINGNNQDNTRENLRFICPNCHSQTTTFRNINRNYSGNIKVSDENLIVALDNNINIRQALLSVGLTPKAANYKRAKRLQK